MCVCDLWLWCLPCWHINDFGCLLHRSLCSVSRLALCHCSLRSLQEMIEANVARGSRVYETGHVLVLGWATSQRDLEVIWKTLEQLCYAYRWEAGEAE